MVYDSELEAAVNSVLLKGSKSEGQSVFSVFLKCCLYTCKNGKSLQLEVSFIAVYFIHCSDAFLLASLCPVASFTIAI